MDDGIIWGVDLLVYVISEVYLFLLLVVEVLRERIGGLGFVVLIWRGGKLGEGLVDLLQT